MVSFADSATATDFDQSREFQRAQFLWEKYKRIESIVILFRLAEKNHAGAITCLGIIFRYGCNLPGNLPSALQCFEKAARMQHPGAMYHLACMYNSGEGGCMDKNTASRLFFHSARLSYPEAQKKMRKIVVCNANTPPGKI